MSIIFGSPLLGFISGASEDGSVPSMELKGIKLICNVLVNSREAWNRKLPSLADLETDQATI